MTRLAGHLTVAPVEYGQLSLAKLIDRIVADADREALHEFHRNRPIFRVKNGPPMLFATFVEAILRGRAGVRGLPTDLGDHANDLTVDKFLRLPVADEGDTACSLIHTDIDCRYYFGMLSRAIQAWRGRHEKATELAFETAAARIVQRHVARHCWLSVLEAKRRLRSGRSRYCWQLAEGSITLWMPQWLSGARRRAWLEANVPTANPTRPGEKERVQALIDEYLGTSRIFAFDERTHTSSTPCNAEDQIDAAIEEEMTVRGLAVFIADEKVFRMTEQRPAIQRLGAEGLRALVHRVFDDLTSGRLEDGAVARAFGLSKATFSRFAGQRWSPNGQRPPDLWLNVARALTCFAPFRNAACAAGVWDSAQSITQMHGTWEDRNE